jgi:lysozyme
MKASINCVNLVREFEGFVATPYVCSGGVWTIGYGSTIFKDGKPVTKFTPSISVPEAEEMLVNDLWRFSSGVTKHIRKPLNQNQFDALVCFSYNVGLGNYAKSTLLKKVNANPNDITIRNEFMRWNRAGGKVLNGLTRRRKSEADLYFKNI